MVRKILVLGVLTIASLAASVSEAAAVYFRGSINVDFTGAMPPADQLGLFALPSQNFEALIENGGGGGAITSGYIVFQGVHYNFTTGTISPGGLSDFTGMLLSNPQINGGGTVGTLSFNFGAGTLLGTTQADFNTFANTAGPAFQSPSGTAIIAMFPGFGVGSYIGAVNAIPEPVSTVALASLVLGCGGYRLRRKRAAV